MVIFFVGPRNVITRRSLLPLVFGVVIGFVLALVFVRSPSRPDWMPYGGEHTHEVELKDPHVGSDLAYAAGPIEGVG